MPDRAPPPDDLPALKRWLAARPDAAELQPIGIQEIVVRSNALHGLSELLADLDAPERVLLVLDETFYRRGGDSLKPLVHEVLSGRGRSVEPCLLAAGGDGLVHADIENVELLRARIGARPSAVVALGSGSVCDVAKQACYLAEREDRVATTLVLVPTAVSVTAFTSSL
ncbi:MAG: iron-containing alcohol dehydrogenase, partial [Chloroflexi bacterium]|nr:iron-containing alcohol dehydrogenase [Chloroflexota bacterium]